jgi:hypothetical protein
MSDKAKARLLAGGLSVLLSAQVVLILLGALVLFNRIHLGTGAGGIGSIFAEQPPIIVSAPPNGTGGAAGAGPGSPGGTTPPTGPNGGTPPGLPCTTDCPAQSAPVLGLNAQTDLPILGPRAIPVRVGSSSGHNFSRTIPLPRARLTVTVSRRPICDLTKCSTRSTSSARKQAQAHPRRFHRPQKKHVPPGQSLAHAIERALRSLLH